MRIAVWDTEYAVQVMIETALELEGNCVFLSADGKSFLDIVQLTQPEVAVVDVLPEYYGKYREIEIIRQALSLNPTLQLIALSTDKAAICRVNVLFPSVRCIMKPFSLFNFRRSLHEMVRIPEAEH
ncbi:hypothetical protein EPA93_09235 [Ktedonosporobacter rubrisoli]|uniref:Response regulatory domain-containing protein n=1 Tax=Ktedonosporobacter rubrisoli TaxID=2509675 RepID=A0A4P6JME5_KTERU|nr:hypothetical protein [Ktedonosporobacter rubrisoli]QBD76182.1 hypothetical protein EPA93_09235 [Ktedonosporobacter rubrisoli]